MIYNIAIDADSLVYKSCHRHMNADKTDVNLEFAYMEFCGEIAKIMDNIFISQSANGDIYKGIIEYEKGDVVNPLIVLSPRKSFRNKISPSGVRFGTKRDGSPKDLGYKANRKPNQVPKIRELKKMIVERLKGMYRIDAEAEADDVVNYYAREHNYFVAAIDKDVINANPTYSFDYNKKKWELPRQPHQIEQWYLMQTLMGDSTDNVAGAPGVGAKGAQDIVYGQHDGQCTYEDIIQYFDSDLDCLINHTLVRMDGFDGEKIIPWSN